MIRFNHRKSVQALNLFAQLQGGSINKMKAIKLFWLADRLHLRKYGRTISGDNYFALKHGPVPSGTRNILEQVADRLEQPILNYSNEYLQANGRRYNSLKEANKKVFSKTDLEALNKVFETYGHLNQFQIRDISHEFPEWKKWEEGLENNWYKSHPMDLKDFFEDAGDKHPIFKDDEESLKLVEKLFIREDKD
ncbi:MAG: Panacea domain-containing protein [Bacteroidota bacterium]|nr:Panacea domain-containing protein [Bacteroidota bacterium]